MTPPTTAPAPAATTAAPGPVPRTRLHIRAQDLTAYRAAARAHLGAPRRDGASPAHPFVAAHALAQHTVTALTAGDPGFTGVVHLAQEIHTHAPSPRATSTSPSRSPRCAARPAAPAWP